MKIAMIGQKGAPATFGGVERHVEELSARLAGRGHEVTVYVRPSYTAARGWWRGVRLEPLPSVPTKHLDAITHSTLCTAAAALGRFDILHYHSVGPTLLAPVARLMGRRVVATVHGQDWLRAKWGLVARLALKMGAAVAAHAPHATIVVSRDLEACMARMGRKAIVIPNGAPPMTRRPIRALARLGLEAGKFVLWMGRFTPEKRVEDLIAAFRVLATEGKLALAGDTRPARAYVERLRRIAGDDGRVLFCGGLYGEEKEEALTNAAAAVVCSEIEGMPIAALEAMQAGLCVIGSDIAPLRELIEPGKTGLLAPARDVAALRRGIEWVLGHAAEARALGAAAQAMVQARYNWDVIAEQTEKVYEGVLRD
ncbi:MAG TPA: glycosyltransferase family 4 protein [Candidatus Brocadiia bacterium]|nr:glycosyltransferase family 4 protein [Candidatus Brocadiia bacterium]